MSKLPPNASKDAVQAMNAEAHRAVARLANALVAKCSSCGQEAPVCCDNGYTDTPGGGTVHDDPLCKNCCGPHGRPRLWPTYERMD